MANISCNLSLPLLKRLEEEKKSSGKTTTAIVQEALTLYLAPKDIESVPPPATKEDIEEIKKMLSNMPTVPLDSPKSLIVEEPTQTGLTIPEAKEKPVPDKDIKHSFSIAPGPGITGRLREAGVNTAEVIKARRNKRAGREYDQMLEKYFGLV